MAGLPEHPILNEIARRLVDLRWAAMLVDTDLRIRFISDEFRGFVGVDDDEVLGYGDNVIAAFMQDVWRERIDVDSQLRIFTDLIPYLLYMLPDSEKHVLDEL